MREKIIVLLIAVLHQQTSAHPAEWYWETAEAILGALENAEMI